VLRKYERPGNVRELANVMERCLVLDAGDVVTIQPDLARLLENQQVRSS
jgi:transcriptional regulator with PAS, ATPase and Fis domain